jgi:hypothetical protein
LFVGVDSDDTGATPTMDYDKAYTIDLSDARAERALNAECETGNWVSYRMPEEKLRGGFRFATVISECPSVVSINEV